MVVGLMFLHLASVDQTSATIGPAIRTPLAWPTALDALLSGGLEIGQGVEELLSCKIPAPRAIRIARVATEGDLVILLVGAADRDVVVFPDPDHLGRYRTGPPYLTLSSGSNACIAATFARAVLAATLRVMQQSPELRQTSPAVDWWPLDATRRLRSLELQCR